VPPTKPLAGAFGEESKPEPAEKRPPKTAQANSRNCTASRDGEGVDAAMFFIEVGPTG
jgi:hypothetical protein